MIWPSLGVVLLVLLLGPSLFAAERADLLAEGKAAYERHCVSCHGPEGKGDGPAAYLLYPKPRNLRSGSFRIVSTWEGVPTDDDILSVLRRGMPGSAMPSWGHLPEGTLRALVAYVKSLREKPFVVPETRPAEEGGRGAGVILVPDEPAYGAPEEARAKELFAEACASCHGATGRGDGAEEQFDEDGYPIRPRDFWSGVFKGSPEPESLYRRIVAGMPGTPMPSSDWAYGEDAWHLVHYILSLSSPRQRERAEMRRFTILAKRVERLPQHPDDGLWARAPKVDLHLMPLWWRPNRPETVTVRAVHDGKSIAFLLVWSDLTHDSTAMRPQDFRDAAAIQFATDRDPPFFAMGSPGKPVNIWMWKAERQADLEVTFQDLEKVYPNLGIDSYPNFLKSPLEQPHRHALTLDSDPTFVTAWGAGNIVADPTFASAAEDLWAEGFGTLRARSRSEQQVKAQGVYGVGSYRVLFRRELRGKGKHAVSLRPGSKTSVAFAVWDGAEGDRDGKKSVTIWQELELEK
ncbi:MAG: hypothetical protein KatS3mg076_0411 [Candidatus Binatia bacterium]|nr:MAG: hypothetical protein KatS3mg076_0411 [Candidatus Binatia bacterium]